MREGRVNVMRWFLKLFGGLFQPADDPGRAERERLLARKTLRVLGRKKHLLEQRRGEFARTAREELDRVTAALRSGDRGEAAARARRARFAQDRVEKADNGLLLVEAITTKVEDGVLLREIGSVVSDLDFLPSRTVDDVSAKLDGLFEKIGNDNEVHEEIATSLELNLRPMAGAPSVEDILARAEAEIAGTPARDAAASGGDRERTEEGLEIARRLRSDLEARSA